MVKNIVFDVGQVLVTFDPPRYLQNLGYDEVTREALMKAMFNDPLWGELDRSIYTKAELEEKFVANAPAYEAQIREVFREIEGIIEAQPYVVEWMEDLKKRGYHLYVLSNYADFMYEATKSKMLFLPYMDGAVFSYMCKAIKPEKEIYETLLKQYNLEAEESVFIDDRAENIEAAKELGFNGIQFHNYEQAKEALNQYLVPMNK